MDDEELLFWSKINSAVASFCLETTLNHYKNSTNKMAVALVGEELEWCGSQAYLFMAKSFLDQEEVLQLSQNRISELENKIKAVETLLNQEITTTNAMKRQLKQTQLSAEDNEWQLQEQLAQMNNMLVMERHNNNDLKSKLQSTEVKLVEVEMFLGSDRGAIALKLEEELADARLRIAELEADKDELAIKVKQFQFNNNNNQYNKENYKI